MQTANAKYPLEPGSASLILIRRYARQLRLSFEDVVLLRAQLGLEIRQRELGIVPMRKRPTAA
jgi:hypothetical protein